MNVDPAAYLEIVSLLARVGLALDEERFEDWPGFFAGKCSYKITTQENVAASLPAGMLLCDSRAMLQDRVLYLRKAAIYNLHRNRRVMSLPVVRRAEADRFEVHTNFVVFQAEPDLPDRIFAFGRYEDVIVRAGGELRFASRLVVLESRSVTPLLSAPI